MDVGGGESVAGDGSADMAKPMPLALVVGGVFLSSTSRMVGRLSGVGVTFLG